MHEMRRPQGWKRFPLTDGTQSGIASSESLVSDRCTCTSPGSFEDGVRAGWAAFRNADLDRRDDRSLDVAVLESTFVG